MVNVWLAPIAMHVNACMRVDASCPTSPSHLLQPPPPPHTHTWSQPTPAPHWQLPLCGGRCGSPAPAGPTSAHSGTARAAWRPRAQTQPAQSRRATVQRQSSRVEGGGFCAGTGVSSHQWVHGATYGVFVLHRSSMPHAPCPGFPPPRIAGSALFQAIPGPNAWRWHS